MIPFKRAIGAYVFASVLVPAICAQATTYYVATTGNDANSCALAKSAGSSKLTIPAGVKCLASGDTLIIKAGTYEGQEIKNPPPGSPSAYTVIMGDPSGPRPVLDPNGELGNNAAGSRGFLCSRGSACSYIELRYIEVTTAFNSVKLMGEPSTGYPHHMRFIDNIFHDTIDTNVLIATSPTEFLGGDHLFQGNEFYRTGVGTPGYAPGFNTIYNTGNRTIIENNVFHNLANGVGIWLKDRLIHNVTVRNNVFYDIGRSNTDTWQKGNGQFNAIHVSVPGGGHKIYNNIIYRSGDQSSFTGIRVRAANDGETNYIYNNTIYDIKHSGAAAIRIMTSTGQHLVKNNIAYLAADGIIGGIQSNNLTDNPSFMDPEKANFTLHSRSAAIDKGVILDLVPTDFAGTRRPVGASYDIGAYEAGDGNTPLAPQDLAVR
ncbi:MAG: right-handed parallel beta-helix repeat-containing protein [Nitrospira sp. BO4]|jgi:hypothetical protein|nr:right-handed parallel beta-helix repeat-containing protein [Nitrospira sp. BO4]